MAGPVEFLSLILIHHLLSVLKLISFLLVQLRESLVVIAISLRVGITIRRRRVLLNALELMLS